MKNLGLTLLPSMILFALCACEQKPPQSTDEIKTADVSSEPVVSALPNETTSMKLSPAKDLYPPEDSGSRSGSRAVVDIDFGNHLNLQKLDSERCTGSLPENVIEDSAWAKVWVDYQPMKDEMGGGLGWIRAKISKCEKGRAQLKFKLPTIAAPTDFRLTLTAASPSGAKLGMMIMDNGQPYKQHWMKVVGLRNERQDITFDFSLPAVDHPVALILNLGKEGTFDLYKLRLSARTTDQIKAEMNRKYPDGGPANVLRNSQFSLGLQSGWNIGINNSLELDIGMEPATESISGRSTVPIRFWTKGGRGIIALASPPINIPLAYKSHTLSFYLRGNCEGDLRILADGQELTKLAISVSNAEQWQRIELPFQPVLLGKFHIFELKAKGDFLLDAMMLGPGEKAGEFELPQHGEISLVLDWRRNNIVFADALDKENIHYELRGKKPAGSRLDARVYNAYGEIAAFPQIPVVGKSLIISGDLPVLPTNPKKPLGPHRIELSLVDADGEPLGPVQELVYHILPRPKYFEVDAPQSAFGLHFNVFEPHMYAAKALGANWVRAHGPNGFLSYWSSVEKEQGKFNYPDSYVRLMRDRGISIIGVLTECPGWARITRPQGGAWLDNWWQPRDYDEFGNYVNNIVAHYRGKIGDWQIWNEPWGGFWFKKWDATKEGRDRWSRGDDPAGDYLRLSKIAFREAKKANPAANVIGVNATGWGAGRGAGWMNEMLAMGAQNYCDTIAFHVYHNNSDFFGSMLDRQSFWFRNLEKNVFGPLREKLPGGGKALWMTEGKSSEQERNSAMYRHTVLGNTDMLQIIHEHASLLPIYHAVMFSENVGKIILYCLEATGFKPPRGIDWAVLTTKSGELNVSASAYAAMCKFLEDKKFVSRTECGEGIHEFIFTATDGNKLAMFAAEPGKILDPAILPTEMIAYDLFGNPLDREAEISGSVVYCLPKN